MTNGPASWRVAPLGQFIQPRKQKGIPSKFPSLPYIGMENVLRDVGIIDSYGNSESYRSSAPKVFPGDVLYGRLRPYLNKVAITKIEAFASGEFIVLPPNESILGRFLQLRLLSQDFVQFTATLDTGDRPRVSWDQISKFEVLLPPLPEQHKIVEILEDHLSRLDAALADVKQARVKAAQFRRSLLQAAFTGNLGSDGTRLMTTVEEWSRSKLSSIADIGWGDLSVTKKSYVEDGYTAFSATGADGFLPYFDYDESGIVVSAIGANCGKIWRAHGKWSCIKNTMRIILKNSPVTLDYLYHFLSDPNSFPKRGSGQPFISKEDARDIEVSYPPLPEQHKIVEILEDHLSRLDTSVALADAMEKQSAGLRRSLFQAAFTGQLIKEVVSV
jgi:type I restriction enzyme S subunit